MLEKTLESVLAYKTKPVNPNRNKLWTVSRRTVLKLQYFGHLMQRLFGKDLMMRKIEGKRRRGWQPTRWLDSITDSKDMNQTKFWKMVKARKVPGVAKSWTKLIEWTTQHSSLYKKCCVSSAHNKTLSNNSSIGWQKAEVKDEQSIPIIDYHNIWFLKRQVRQSVCPSLSEFSRVYCDPHIQRLWHSE